MRILLLGICILNFYFNTQAQITYPGKQPGKAAAHYTSNVFTLENNSVRIVFRLKNNQLQPIVFKDKANNQEINLLSLNWFELKLKSGEVISDKNFQLIGKLVIQSIMPQKKSAQYSGQLGGKTISATFINSAAGLKIKWKVKLTDNANYIQQQWLFEVKDSLPLVKCTMLEIPVASVSQAGKVDGSPLVSNQMFFVLEHPMSKNELNEAAAVAYLPLQNALQSSAHFSITTVMGATPAQQLRRGFLYYLERERAHPYRSFLHYNSWYDLSWVDRKMEDASCLDRIRIYGDSLIKKRKVNVKAFLFDDGWDNDSTLWGIRKSFPDGFSNVQKLADSYHSKLGVWISPWGGYDPSQSLRLKYGRMQNPPFETNKNGFSMAGPVYYNRFKEVATNFMKKNGVAIFKFDGVGAGNGASGAGLEYQKDIEALLKLTQELREVDPDLYLSLTVGTWPSPNWLRYGDAIWRAGSDFGLTGSGSNRQKWITYRDAESYKNVVKRAPLFPLNAVMLHGINIADVGYPKKLEMEDQSIKDEIWAFFASGTSLQEMYINPHLLSAKMWDWLAKAARWSEANADVLQDVHWVGGNPAEGEMYGYASWSPRKGIFSLRNPSAETKTFSVDIEKIFELPANTPASYTLQEVIEQASPSQKIQKGKTFTVTLQPYQLKIWESIPVK